jgi:hypothetical protein
MNRLLAAATVAIALSPMSVVAGGHKHAKDPFEKELEQQRAARQAEIRDWKEREERAQQVQRQRELDHPEIMYDEREDDLDE